MNQNKLLVKQNQKTFPISFPMTKSAIKNLDYSVSKGFIIPDFLESQTQSFKTFLKSGLISELNRYGYISTRLEDLNAYWCFFNDVGGPIKMPLDGLCDVIFHGHAYKLKKPRLSVRQCILKRRTYSSELFVPIEFIYHPTKEIFTEWFLLAHLPMMTNNGHFIINGSPRIIMNQIVRRPGVYLKKIVTSSEISTCVADFIAQRGTWLRLEISGKRYSENLKVWARLKRIRKCPVNLLLSDLGLSDFSFDQFFHSQVSESENSQIKESENSQTNKSEMLPETFKDHLSQMEEFLSTNMRVLPARFNSRKGYFRKKFANPYTYSLSRTGRKNLNQRLGLTFPLTQTTLTAEDVLIGCCQLIKFFNENQKDSDIDDLSNRKIRSSGELIQAQLNIGLLKLREEIKNKLNNPQDFKGQFWQNRLNQLNRVYLNPKKIYKEKKAYFRGLIASNIVNRSLKTFFATNALSQFLDQTNPIAELTHKRRISSLGEGGINRETAGMAIRGIHPSHYGRVCPIETPEGQNAGLVNSFTAYANLNQLGLVKTPFYRLHKGVVLKDQHPYLFSPEQEKHFILAPGDLSIDLFNVLPNKKIPVRQAKNFNRLWPSQVDFMAVGPLQMISVATSLIPFLEHDDGNRALMGSNMQRQAVPTLIPRRPIVGTGFESKIIADSQYGLQAETSGFVSYVDSQKILLYNGQLNELNVTKLKSTNKFKTLHSPSAKHMQIKHLSQIWQKNHSNILKNSEFQNKICEMNEKINSKIPRQLNDLTLLKQKKIILLFATNRVFGKSISNDLQLFNFTTKQLLNLFTLNMDQELQSLRYLFNFMSYELVNLKLLTFFPVMTKAILEIFEQTITLSFFKQWCFFLINCFQPSFAFNFVLNKSVLMSEKRKKLYFSLFFQLSNQTKTTLKFQSCNALFTLNKKNQRASTKFNSNKDPLITHNKFFIEKASFLSINVVTMASNNFKKINNFLLRKPLQPKYKKNQNQLLYDPSKLFIISPFTNEKQLLKMCIQSFNKKQTSILKKLNPLNSQSKISSHLCNQLNPFEFGNQEHVPLKLQTDLKTDLTTFAFNNFQNNKQQSIYMDLTKSKNLEFTQLAPKRLINQNAFQSYKLDSFLRSNQGTAIAHRPAVSPGQWVEQGDLLADNRATCKGELAIGQNLLVGYTPWEGYNFEDAVLLSQRAISEDLFTTIHIERYEVSVKDTQYGREIITSDLPALTNASALEFDGVIKVGTWVESGDILVGKATPLNEENLSSYELLLYDIINKSKLKYKVKDTSLRLPNHVKGRVIHVEKLKYSKLTNDEPHLITSEKRSSDLGEVESRPNSKFKLNSDLNLDSNFDFNSNLEPDFDSNIDPELGLNDAVNFPSAELSKLTKTKKKFLTFDWDQLKNEKTTFISIDFVFPSKKLQIRQLKKNLLNFSYFKRSNESLKNPVLETRIQMKNTKPSSVVSKKIKRLLKQKKSDLAFGYKPLEKVQIYIAEQRKVQVGDKIAGRHGNKGIISAILPREDMPYLPDGSSLDLVLNPLGVPSRMNVGQLFECLLGLAGSYLNQTYKIQPFDETYGPEASRSLVYSKLYEARLKTNQSWLFNPNYPGKTRLFDGRTGECFEQPVTVGKAYILKLIHLVDEKIHARSTGPYSLVTQQPLRGRSSQGGQRVGEMEVWAFEGFGAAYLLQELFTIKSDDMKNRKTLFNNILEKQPFEYGFPESFHLLMGELQCLCLKVVVGRYRKLPLIQMPQNLQKFGIHKNKNVRSKRHWPF